MAINKLPTAPILPNRIEVDGATFIKAEKQIHQKVAQTINKIIDRDGGADYSLPIATSSVLGGVKVGTGLTVTEDGTLNGAVNYTLPTASSSTLGGVKVGTGLSIGIGGTLSVDSGVINGEFDYTKTFISTYENGWENYSYPGSDSRGSYYRDAAGIVRLEGFIKNPLAGPYTAPYTAFTLPADYRPQRHEYFSVSANGGPAAIIVRPDGTVSVLGTVSTHTWTCLDGVAYKTSDAWSSIPGGDETTPSSSSNGMISIMDYGGNNRGTGDNATALNSAIAACPTGQVQVFFPPGTYNFSSQFVYTIPGQYPFTSAVQTNSITLVGAGVNVTKLNWANGGGMQINYSTHMNCAHIRDLSLHTGSVATGTALKLVQLMTTATSAQAFSDVTNVDIGGIDGYGGANTWACGIDLYGVWNTNFVNVSMIGGAAYSGTGISLSAGSSYACIFNLTSCNFSYLNTGLLIGSYIQGVTVSQSNFGGNMSIYVPSTNAGYIDQIGVANSQFANGVGTGPIFKDDYGCVDVMFSNCLFIGGAGSALRFSKTSGFTVSGCSFNGGNIGVEVVESAADCAGIIIGNVFRHHQYAVWLRSTAKNINVQSNAYFSNANTVVNQGTGNTIGGGSQ